MAVLVYHYVANNLVSSREGFTVEGELKRVKEEIVQPKSSSWVPRPPKEGPKLPFFYDQGFAEEGGIIYTAIARKGQSGFWSRDLVTIFRFRLAMQLLPIDRWDESSTS